MRRFTAKEDKFLRDNYLTIPAKTMTKMLGRSESAGRQRMILLGIKVPAEVIERFKKESQYKKGSQPANKGKKMVEWMRPEQIQRTVPTRFKTGQKGWNYKPLGYERITKDGYMERKIAEPKTFKAVHRIIYEETYGAIPKGLIVVFKDGNQLNCDPKNLEAITRMENMKRNTYHNLPKPLAQIVQLRGALNRQINKHLKIQNEK